MAMGRDIRSDFSVSHAASISTISIFGEEERERMLDERGEISAWSKLDCVGLRSGRLDAVRLRMNGEGSGEMGKRIGA